MDQISNTIRKEDIKRLEAFEMLIWRRMEEIRWAEHITNEEVLGNCWEKKAMIHRIRKRQRRWIRHMRRKEKNNYRRQNGGTYDLWRRPHEYALPQKKDKNYTTHLVKLSMKTKPPDGRDN